MYENYLSHNYGARTAAYKTYEMLDHDNSREASNFEPIDWETYK